VPADLAALPTWMCVVSQKLHLDFEVRSLGAAFDYLDLFYNEWAA
jgi:hypothetical protein